MKNDRKSYSSLAGLFITQQGGGVVMCFLTRIRDSQLTDIYRPLSWPCNAVGRLCVCLRIETKTLVRNDL